jgi:hypothetical protein
MYTSGKSEQHDTPHKMIFCSSNALYIGHVAAPPTVATTCDSEDGSIGSLIYVKLCRKLIL